MEGELERDVTNLWTNWFSFMWKAAEKALPVLLRLQAPR